MDNFYTSLDLLKSLRNQQIYATGTVRTNRLGFPKSLVTILKSNNFRNSRGEFHFRQQDGMVATIWMDNAPVAFISSGIGADATAAVGRRQPDGDLKSVECPMVVIQYNKFMGGVDLHDQLRETYSFHRKCVRWWLPLFFYMLDVCIVNAFIIFDLKFPKKFTHKQFRTQLMKELVTKADPENAQRGRRRRRNSQDSEPEHSPTREDKRGDCVVCSNRGQKEGKEIGKRVRTHYKCNKCDKYMCPNICFEAKHSE